MLEELMKIDRQKLIKKTLIKLGMLGDPKDPIPLQEKKELLKDFWNERNPENIVKSFGKTLQKYNPSKEAIQDLFKYLKLKGLFKRSFSLHPKMEETWRSLLKQYGLKGFLLEN